MKSKVEMKIYMIHFICISERKKRNARLRRIRRCRFRSLMSKSGLTVKKDKSDITWGGNLDWTQKNEAKQDWVWVCKVVHYEFIVNRSPGMSTRQSLGLQQKLFDKNRWLFLFLFVVLLVLHSRFMLPLVQTWNTGGGSLDICPFWAAIAAQRGGFVQEDPLPR